MTSVHWLLGLPFDPIGLEDARNRIFAAAESRRQLVFATPNVNFLAQAHRDPRFRQDILHTDLSLADGRPVVWLGRLLGIPFVERVAGSDLIESLIARPGPRPLKVFFFGGEAGAAAAASAALNHAHGGLVGAGSYYPGFTDLEQMSSAEAIDAINRSEADLLVVSLGAVKGHRWIEANRHRLHVPVISHLGAVVNFVAGRMRRAPRLMQRMGVEWLWRIIEEPKLFTRYARDAVYLLDATCRIVLPQLMTRLLPQGQSLLQACVGADGSVSVTVEGRLGAGELAQLHKAGTAEVKLRNVRHLDPAGAGWLYERHFRRAGADPGVACDTTSTDTLQKLGYPLMDAPDLSVIVVNYNTRHLLQEMMAALDAAAAGMNLQLIIIDNASRDGSADYIRQTWPRIELLANSSNVGFGRANNQALPLVRSSNVLLLNTDAFLRKDSLHAALGVLSRYPQCGIVGVRLVGRDGVVQPSCRYFPTAWNLLLVRTGLAGLFPRTRLVDDAQWDDRKAAACDWVPGAFLLIRKAVIDQVGLFDPRYFLYYEEVDLCRAAKAAGWTVRYCPDTDVVHVGGESARSDGALSSAGRQLPALQVESELLYFRKHYGLAGVLGGLALGALGDTILAAKQLLGRARGAGQPFSHSALSWRLFLQTRLATRPTR